MAFFNKLNPFGAPGLRTLGKSAPIKKLGMSPKQSGATPGIGPSNNMGGMQNAQQAAQMGLQQRTTPYSLGSRTKGAGIMQGQGGGKQMFGDPGMQTKLPMRDMGTGPSIFQGNGGGGTMMRPQMNDMMVRRPGMGGMQDKIRQMMEMGRGMQGPQDTGQLQGTPNPEGVMPESLPTGQPMPQEPGAGPSPDMMQQLMGRMGGNRGFGGGMRRGYGGGQPAIFG
jgi:hypothetical protein